MIALMKTNKPFEGEAMRRSILISVSLFVLGGLILAACAPAASPVASQPTATGQLAAGSIQINGAGATFPFPLYSRWFYDYAFVDPSVRFNYQSIGSGGGIQQITQKTVDFGASDAILSNEQLAAAPGLQMFPTVAGAEAIVVNLKDAQGNPITTPLKFPGTTIADIYLGKITKWNDPLLTAANPDVKLPDQNIIVVHRSDGSGTTYIFTDYLSSVSQEWKTKVGKGTSVDWPVGLGGKGNEGVAGTVSQNVGSIGYVELAYALQNKFVINLIQNQAGAYVAPSMETTQSAMTDFGSNLGEKLALSIVNGPGKNSYPIAGYTYMLLYMNQQDCVKADKIVQFMKWAYGPNGTKDASDLSYVPLPDAVKQQVLARLAQITCQGKPLGN
jgi:phosphate transport system substrate-binding protein